MSSRTPQRSTGNDPGGARERAVAASRGTARRTRPTAPSSASTALEAGLALLARRSYPEAALRKKLDATWPAADTDAAITRLRELGMIDDEAWARRYVETRTARSGGRGRHRLAAELVACGIARPLASGVVAEIVGDADERRRAHALLTSLLSRLATRGGPAPTVATLSPSERARLFRRLIARGYPSGLVRDLLAVS